MTKIQREIVFWELRLAAGQTCFSLMEVFVLYASASWLTRMLLVSVCTRATNRSWSPLWSWRAMPPCGLLQWASTKCASPSARTQSWRCAQRAWAHRLKHCGSVQVHSCWVSSQGRQQPAALPPVYFTLFPCWTLATVPWLSSQHQGSTCDWVSKSSLLLKEYNQPSERFCQYVTWTITFLSWGPPTSVFVSLRIFTVAKREPVLCAYLHGGSRGEATHHSHSVLLKDLQGSGAFTASRQHHLRLQGECGNLFAGKPMNEKEFQSLRQLIFKGRNRLLIYTWYR